MTPSPGLSDPDGPLPGWNDDLEPPPVAPPPVESEPGLHAVRHLFSALLCLIATPAAIGLLAYGGERYQEVVLRSAATHDLRGLAALAAGGFLLLLVACSGAASPLGPLLSGLIFGLAPAAMFLVAPHDTVDRIADIPMITEQIQAGLISWLAVGGVLAVGAVLFGTGFTAALRRR